MLTLYSSIVISVISIFLGYFLTAQYGIIGASSSISLCVCLSVAFQLFVAKYKIGVSPYSKKVLILILLVPIILMGCMLIDSSISNMLVCSFIKVIGVTILYFYIVCKFRISEDVSYIIEKAFTLLCQKFGQLK